MPDDVSLNCHLKTAQDKLNFWPEDFWKENKSSLQTEKWKNNFHSAYYKYHQKEGKLILTMQCEEVGVKKTTPSYTYSKARSKEGMPHFPRGVCLRSWSSLWCTGLLVTRRDALPSTLRFCQTLLCTPEISSLFHKPYVDACGKLKMSTLF